MALLKLNLLFLIFFAVFIQNKDAALVWNPTYKLSWADFKGKPNLNSDAVAITASGITFNYSITKESNNDVLGFATEVYAHFYPKQSWYKIDSVNNHILSHEQVHFDITELYARISKLKVSNSIKKQLKKLHYDINTELSEIQHKYDTETDFSRNFKFQAQWRIFIETELKMYEKSQNIN